MKKRIFLDYASATPLDARVFKAMKPWLEKDFANPAGLYEEGVVAKKALDTARTKVARTLQCRTEEVVFTSGGTESNNLAIQGVAISAARASKRSPHIITSVIEHPAVLEVCRALEGWGNKVKYLPVDKFGHISLRELEEVITKETTLITLAYANSEIGTLNPVREIGKIVKKVREKNKSVYPYLHIDAGQVPLFYSVQPNELGVDLLTLDAAKFYGPKGSGALFVQRNLNIEPIIRGGKQERGLRAGTENVAGAVGLAEAVALATTGKEKESARLSKLRDLFISKIQENFPKMILNGDQEWCLPNNVNICFPGINAEFAVIKLDNAGVACSSASACRSLSDETYSYVVEAIGRKDCAESSLRFTFGRSTTEKEILEAVKIISKQLK